MLGNGLYCYITCLCGRPLCSETPAKLSQLTFMQWSDVSFMPHPCKRQVSSRCVTHSVSAQGPLWPIKRVCESLTRQGLASITVYSHDGERASPERHKHARHLTHRGRAAMGKRWGEPSRLKFQRKGMLSEAGRWLGLTF